MNFIEYGIKNLGTLLRIGWLSIRGFEVLVKFLFKFLIDFWIKQVFEWLFEWLFESWVITPFVFLGKKLNFEYVVEYVENWVGILFMTRRLVEKRLLWSKCKFKFAQFEENFSSDIFQSKKKEDRDKWSEITSE